MSIPKKHRSHTSGSVLTHNFQEQIQASAAPRPVPITGGDSSTSQEDNKPCRQKTLLDIQFECELDSVRDGEGIKGSDGDRWPVSATLTNGVVVDCDFVISATGAKPNTNVLGDEFEVKALTIAFAYIHP